MKFDEIKALESALLEQGAEADAFLKEQIEEEPILNVIRTFYVRLLANVICIWLSFFFLVLANVITLTRDSGSPYLTTQDGITINISKHEVQSK
ncbi:hypothetical protein ACI2KR_06995 [Pseudomonas luteola]